MKLRSRLPAIAAAVMLLAACAAFIATRDPNGRAGAAAQRNQAPLVDDQLLQTARQLSVLADSSDEQELASQAVRLADHELDVAFATALRRAEAMPPPTTGPLAQLTARMARLKARMAAYNSRIQDLTKKAGSDDASADELAVLKAQLSLDQDRLQDAQQDLERQGGDRHATLERALEEHEAVQHQPAPPARAPVPPDSATLVEQARLWLDLNGRDQQILAARQQAAAEAAALLKEHEAREAEAASQAPADVAPNPDASVAQIAVAQLQRRSDQTKTLAEYDRRIADSRQLADVYGNWSALLEGRRRGALHRLLGSLALVLGIVLAVILIDQAISHAFGRTDRRRLQQMRSVSKLAVQLLGLLLVALILFGPPTQISTLIGLATAGLTVALKDFIVGFLGWFVLLGRNGIHLGDWVEIEGVGGEVIEIGLLKTVLLEVGSRSSTGHPTGRRVSFVNSFAIEGHFFNFSTTGQWLWDELQVTLPAAGDPYKMAEQITALVARETEADAREAEQDWQRVTAQYGVREFSAQPAVDLRPGAAGLDVVVRYITRAPLRYQVKSRLFQGIVSLLQPSAGVSNPA